MDSKHPGDMLKLSTHIDHNDYKPGARAVLAVIRNNWRPENIEIKKCGVGFVNLVLVASHGEEKVVFKIYGGDCFTTILDTKRQTTVTLIFNEIGISPRILCLFENGVCFEFVEGETSQWTNVDLFDDVRIPKACARELAKIHCNKTRQLAVEKYKMIPKCGFDNFLETLYGLYPTRILVEDKEAEELLPQIPSLEYFKTEMEKMKAVLSTLDLPVVLCHNDVNITNVIYKRQTDKAVIVDYDMSDFRFAEFDLANLLLTPCLAFVPVARTHPRWQPGYWRDVLREYLVSKCELDGEEFSETLLDERYLKLRKVAVVFTLVYTFYFFVDVGLPKLPFGTPSYFLKLGLGMHKQYLEIKKDFLDDGISIDWTDTGDKK